MKIEMEQGGTPLFFDLFVAMCNHMVRIQAVHCLLFFLLTLSRMT